MMYMFASCLPTALLPHSIPFTRYVKNHILDPLGLTDSTYYHDVAAESHVLAQGFTRRGIDSLDEVFAGEPVALEYWQPIVNEETNGKNNTITLFCSLTLLCSPCGSRRAYHEWKGCRDLAAGFSSQRG